MVGKKTVRSVRKEVSKLDRATRTRNRVRLTDRNLTNKGDALHENERTHIDTVSPLNRLKDAASSTSSSVSGLGLLSGLRSNESRTNSILANESPSFEQHMADSMREVLVRLDEIANCQHKIGIQMANLEISLVRKSKPKVLDGVDVMELMNLGLPVHNAMQLGQLDYNLMKEDFVNKITEILTKIGGSKGDTEGDKVLELLMHAIIAPKMLAAISWSGRAGSGKPKKIPLKKYHNTVSLISSLCRKADRKYTHEEILYDVKYKVLKYAAKHIGDDVQSNASGQIIDVCGSPENTQTSRTTIQSANLPPSMESREHMSQNRENVGSGHNQNANANFGLMHFPQHQYWPDPMTHYGADLAGPPDFMSFGYRSV